MIPRQRAAGIFLATAACGALPPLIAVFSTDKLALHEAINSQHAALFDLLFRWITHLADGLVPTAIAVALMLWKDWRSGLMVGLSAGLSAIAVQFLKRSVFRIDRPAEFLSAMPSLQLVEGVELHHHFSFPSGHSTAAFSTALALAVILGRTGAAFGLALLACLIAFTRVYLSQHYTEDVLAGAALGSLTAMGVYAWLYRSAFAERPWLDRALLRVQNQ
jgi:membrane-associated phospholipid phosphatase